MRIGKIIGIVFLLIIIIITGAVFFIYQSLASSSTVTAQLHVENGEVKVNDAIVTGNVKLKQGNVIETLDGLATVILYESTLISLDKNTKITLEELILKHPKVKQEEGKSWSKFTKVVGSEDYSIKTGNTVASVRGTGFLLSENKIVTGEGSVDYEVDGKAFVVNTNKVVEKKNDEIIERDATKEELAEIKKNIERSIRELKYTRNLEIEKKKFLLEQAKKRFSITDEQIQEALDQADKGEVDIDEMINQYKDKIPAGINLKSADKVIGITKEIQSLNKMLNES